MSQTPNKWNICDGRGEEGKGWRGSEEQGGQLAPWVQASGG